MTAPRRAIPHAALVLVTDASRLAARSVALEDAVRSAVEGGVQIVQLRDKTLGHAELIEAGQRLREAIAGRALFFVNGDMDAAQTLNADGLHIPSYGPTIRDVRRRLGDEILISLAVHHREGAIRAAAEGADIVQLGTVFPSGSHPDVRALGIDAFADICRLVRAPVIGIGGITPENAAAVITAGAAGVAVISAILDASDPRAAAAALRAAIDSAATTTPPAPPRVEG